ncbi:nucleoside deaminase [Alicyclobacillaceae bacterium I2511]|nr:nucleoside deaminase [Alicyclobacillaceae bacterium I2511]
MQEVSHEHWMRVALDYARTAGAQGEVPIGAVLVRDGHVLAGAYNLRETWQDPTAHAELLAIQQASRQLGGWRLTNCDLYVTLEPCPMCAGAAVLSRIRHIYYGASDPKGGALESKLNLLAPGLWNHLPEVSSGILAEECGMILKDFFRDLRGKSAFQTWRDV